MKIANKAALVLLLTAILGFIAIAIYQRNVVAFIAAPRRARLFAKKMEDA